jgi:hypothetical protein
MMLAVLAGFWIMPVYMTRQQIFDICNAFGIVVAIGVTLRYLPGAIAAVRTRRWVLLSRMHYLTLGISLAWLAFASRNVWSWTWRALGYPVWMADHPFLAWTVYVIAWSGILHILAHDIVEDTEVPPRFLPRYKWAKAAGHVLAGVTIGAAAVYFLRHFD